MNGDMHLTALTVAGGFLLFAAIAVLLTLSPDLSGRATQGETATQVNIINSTPVNCSVVGVAGYNIVAFPCITSAEALGNVINDSTGVAAMYQYMPGEADRWHVYNPNLPLWVEDDLQFLSRRVGYVLILNQSATYTTSGAIAFSTDVPIVAGWSLAGYPSMDVRNITDGTAGINATITEIRTYDPAVAGYVTYRVSLPVSTLVNLTPGIGYWINGTAAATWTVAG